MKWIVKSDCFCLFICFFNWHFNYLVNAFLYGGLVIVMQLVFSFKIVCCGLHDVLDVWLATKMHARESDLLICLFYSMSLLMGAFFLALFFLFAFMQSTHW